MCQFWAAMAVLFIALRLFCSFSYTCRTLCLIITSFAQISWCSFLCLLDMHPLLWDSEFQWFAWTFCRYVSIVGWGRDWWLSLYVFPPTSPKVQGNKNGKKKKKEYLSAFMYELLLLSGRKHIRTIEYKENSCILNYAKRSSKSTL